MEALDYVLDRKSLDYVWVSHTELPHAGNALALLRNYPDSKVIAAKGGDHYKVHGLEKAILAAPGDKIRLGEHALHTVDPLFVDHGLTQWVYERKSGLLCTVDWGHNFHVTPGECFEFLDEMDESLPFLLDDIVANMRTQFPWLAWTNSEQTNEAIDQLFSSYDIRVLAPIHAAVVRQDISEYVKLLKEAMLRCATLPFVLDLEPATSLRQSRRTGGKASR